MSNVFGAYKDCIIFVCICTVNNKLKNVILQTL